MLFLIILLSAACSVALPSVFVLIRESTKVHRQGIIQDLIKVFERRDENYSSSIPSFEFVKYKYLLPSGGGADRDRKRDDFSATHWILSALPLIGMTFVLNVLCLGIVIHAVFRWPIPVDVDWLNSRSKMPLVAWVLLASYVGAMLFMLKSFIQAINNFDLSPFSLVGAGVNLAFSISAGLLFIFGVARVPEAAFHWDLGSAAGFPLVLLGAFTAGYFPDVAVRNVMRWSNLRFRKEEDEEVYKAFKSVPLEIIDGIDSEIRSRLEDYHISTVQNLAAANPLMLFVETPYGVYQIMDWVAQAQLCASVGPSSLSALWRIGIRTIFDLERVALDKSCSAPELIETIGVIIWKGPDTSLSKQPIVPDLSAIDADIRFRLENPHVLRLRQIFNQVSDSIGHDARRLSPIVDCEPSTGKVCPFARREAA